MDDKIKTIVVPVQKLQTTDGQIFDLRDKQLAIIHQQMIDGDESIVRDVDYNYFRIVDGEIRESDYYLHTHLNLIMQCERRDDNKLINARYPLYAFSLPNEYIKKLTKIA